jgi:hypothetical protein
LKAVSLQHFGDASYLFYRERLLDAFESFVISAFNPEEKASADALL